MQSLCDAGRGEDNHPKPTSIVLGVVMGEQDAAADVDLTGKRN